MRFFLKEYRTLKIKKFLKNNIIFINFLNSNVNNWIYIYKGQDFKKMNFNYYRVFSKISLKILKNSVFEKCNIASHGFTVFVKPELDKLQLKHLFLNSDVLSFKTLSIKVNRKIYTVNQLKKMVFLKYSENVLFYYIFKIIILNLFAEYT